MPRRLWTATARIDGVFVVLLAAWAGIVAFVGPTFGYAVHAGPSWQWNLDLGWLHFAPGVAGVVAGLLVLASSSSPAQTAPGAVAGRSRRLRLALASTLAAVAGAWLVIGPLAWPVLRPGSASVFRRASPLHTLADQVGANLGPGLLLVLLGALALGLATAGRATVGAAPEGRRPVTTRPEGRVGTDAGPDAGSEARYARSSSDPAA